MLDSWKDKEWFEVMVLTPKSGIQYLSSKTYSDLKQLLE